MIFTDYREPKVAKKSHALIKLMTEIKPKFDKLFKFVQTDQRKYDYTKDNFGIVWDELPAIGINSMTGPDTAYPRDQPFDKRLLIKWLEDHSK